MKVKGQVDNKVRKYSLVATATGKDVGYFHLLPI